MTFTPNPPPPNSGNPATFNEDADAFFGWLAVFVAELIAQGYPNLPALFRINGTALAPALTWDGDSDTGLYRPGVNQLGITAGGTMRALFSATEAQINVPVKGSAVQSDATDATAGRLLKVGAFGLGAPGPRIGNAGATDNSIAPGCYAYEGLNGSSGGPDGQIWGNLIHVRRAPGGGEAQIFIGDGGAFAIFTRSRGTSAWTPWVRLDPVGGSNSNGEFVRFSDGTQICAGRATTLTTGPVTATFPASFTASPHISLTIRSTNPSLLGTHCHGLSATGAAIVAFNGSGGRVAAAVDYLAFGRWL